MDINMDTLTWTYSLYCIYPCCISMSILHVHTCDACPWPCCMSMSIIERRHYDTPELKRYFMRRILSSSSLTSLNSWALQIITYVIWSETKECHALTSLALRTKSVRTCFLILLLKNLQRLLLIVTKNQCIFRTIRAKSSAQIPCTNIHRSNEGKGERGLRSGGSPPPPGHSFDKCAAWKLSPEVFNRYCT
jgi:hypothetical protein